MPHVLIIDDEEFICEMLSTAFKMKGYASDFATSGLLGLSMFYEGHYNVVITDIKLPDVSGNEIAKEIRCSKRSDTTLIGISGTFDLLDQTLFHAAYAKPVNISLLIETVENLVGSNKGVSQP